MNIGELSGKELVEIAEMKGINWRKFKKIELIQELKKIVGEEVSPKEIIKPLLPSKCIIQEGKIEKSGFKPLSAQIFNNNIVLVVELDKERKKNRYLVFKNKILLNFSLHHDVIMRYIHEIGGGKIGKFVTLEKLKEVFG